LDAQIEDLARRLVEVVNKAGPEHRQDLREYAIDLLREGTEAVDTGRSRPASSKPSGTNPLGLAILLFLVALPMCLLFTPVGLILLAFAVVLGLWGIIAVVVRR
jgi:hypothetical protein